MKRLALLLVFWSGHVAGQFNYRVRGLGFGPYIVPGESPGVVLSESVLEARLNLIKPYTQDFRTYGCGNGLGVLGAIAKRNNMRIAMTAWIGKDHAANLAEVDCVIARAAAGEVDIAVIGNEALLRNDVTDGQLQSYIQRFKDGNTRSVPVTTSDSDLKILAAPLTFASVDQVFVHIYPFWEGYPLQSAISLLHRRYTAVRTAVGNSARPNRAVVIGETGWPRAGAPKGAAIPSAEAAATYFLQFVSWARANNAGYYYFEALPEPWKAGCAACDVEPHFGVIGADGNPLPGMISVFEGKRLPDTWTGTAVVGSGSPSISLTYVPPLGKGYDPNLPLYANLGSFLHGRVSGAAPGGCVVGAYIQVAGNWFVKPFADGRRASPVLADGSWRAQIDSFGGDANATSVAGYLFCDGSLPPTSLPSNPSYPSVSQARTNAAISGRLIGPGGGGVEGAAVHLGGFLTRSTGTAPGGFYSFPQINAGVNYTVTPSLTGASFSPAVSTLTNLGATGVSDLNFSASTDPSAAPAITAPSPNQTVGVSAVSFGWNTVAGASGYDLAIHDTVTGTTVFTGQMSGQTASNTVINLPDGSYRFLARACFGGLAATGCGAFRDVAFRVLQSAPSIAPSITAPVNDQSITQSTIQLTWTPVAGSGRYELLVRDQSTGLTELNVTEIAPSTSSISSFRSAADYRARVRACSLGCGPWSAEVRFAIALPPVPGTAPVIVQPVSVSNGNRVTFSWNQIGGADLYQALAVQPGAGPGGGALTVAARQISQTSITLDVPAGTASLLVRACNGDGCGPYSNAVAIAPPGPNPAVPSLGTPMAGTNSGNPVLLTWNRVPGDNGSNTTYRIYVQDFARSSAALDVRTNQNFWAAWFRPGVRYDALVIANPDGAAVQGPASAFFVRGVNPPEPAMTQPQLNGSVTQGNVTVAWTPIDGATGYEYYVVAAGNPVPAATGVTPGLSVQVPLTAVGGSITPYSAQARACLAISCDPSSLAGWSNWAGATNFNVKP